MTTPLETLTRVLTNAAADTRRTVAYYGNLRASDGPSRRPRRLLSEVGFPRSSPFSYVVPSPSHVVRGEQQRACDRITLCPYGAEEDHRRLASTRPEDRVVTTAAGSAGVRVYAGNPAFYVHAGLDPDTSAPGKTLRLVQALLARTGGPAYHVVVARTGAVYVCAALDDETRAAGSRAATSVDVAVETALAIRAEDHAARRLDRVVELPLTDAQLACLAVIAGKVRTGYPAFRLGRVAVDEAGAGVAYRWTLAPVTPLNFSGEAWRGASPFDHAESDHERFAQRVDALGAFDLATEVFRAASAPPPSGARGAAQAAVSQVATAGARVVAMGAYAAVAGGARAEELASQSRLRLFVDRIAVAHRDAHDASAAAGHVAAATSHPPAAATGVEPHTFDFATGLWGDGKAY